MIIKNFSVGVSAEAGNTWAYQEPVTFGSLKTAGSIYVIADTLIGPLFVGYGRSGSNRLRVSVPEPVVLARGGGPGSSVRCASRSTRDLRRGPSSATMPAVERSEGAEAKSVRAG